MMQLNDIKQIWYSFLFVCYFFYAGKSTDTIRHNSVLLYFILVTVLYKSYITIISF